MTITGVVPRRPADDGTPRASMIAYRGAMTDHQRAMLAEAQRASDDVQVQLHALVDLADSQRSRDIEVVGVALRQQGLIKAVTAVGPGLYERIRELNNLANLGAHSGDVQAVREMLHRGSL